MNHKTENDLSDYFLSPPKDGRKLVPFWKVHRREADSIYTMDTLQKLGFNSISELVEEGR